MAAGSMAAGRFGGVLQTVLCSPTARFRWSLKGHTRIREQIRALYEMARTVTRESGRRQVGDHIVPLHHPLVCRLHVPAKLRVIPERINAEKHNRFEIGGEALMQL